jgi:hypothetical protein
MGLNPNTLPSHIVEKIDKEDRSPEILTMSEAIDKNATRLEREEQRTFAQMLSLARSRRELDYDWPRTDKRPTGRIEDGKEIYNKNPKKVTLALGPVE